MSAPFQFQRRVQFRDTDAAGIVHFSVFFNYMEEAECALLRHLGLSVVMEDDQGRFSFPRVAAQCNYRQPLQFGDDVLVCVTVAKLGTSSIIYNFEFSRDDLRIADGQVTAVCCRLNDEDVPSSTPLPAAVSNKLSGFVISESS